MELVYFRYLTCAQSTRVNYSVHTTVRLAPRITKRPTKFQSICANPQGKERNLSVMSQIAVPGAGKVRTDAWVWAVRLAKTRSRAAGACRAGHIKVNGDRAKPSTPIRVGDEVRVYLNEVERIVEVVTLITKRVGAPIAVTCYVDNTPAPIEVEKLVVVAQRDRGAGRPTKRERRELDRLRGRSSQ